MLFLYHNTTVRNVVFWRNRAVLGGGAFALIGDDTADDAAAATTPSLANVAFVGNYAGSRAGALGVLGSGAPLTCDGCSFVGNGADGKGGALYLDFGTTVLLSGETRLLSNAAARGGGALAVDGSSMAMLSGTTTIAHNWAAADGGGVYLGTWGFSGDDAIAAVVSPNAVLATPDATIEHNVAARTPDGNASQDVFSWYVCPPLAKKGFHPPLPMSNIQGQPGPVLLFPSRKRL